MPKNSSSCLHRHFLLWFDWNGVSRWRPTGGAGATIRTGRRSTVRRVLRRTWPPVNYSVLSIVSFELCLLQWGCFSPPSTPSPLPPTPLTYLLVSDIFSYFWRFQLSWVIWSLECRPRARGFRLVVASSPLSAFHWYYYYFPLAKGVIRALLDNAWALIISNLRYDINYKRSKLILSDVRWASEWAGNTWPKTYNQPLSVPDGH